MILLLITHFGVEDLSLLRPLKNIEVIWPADPIEAKAAAKYVLNNKGPAYIRLGKNKEPELYENEIVLEKGIPLVHGEIQEFLLLSTGPIGLQTKNVVKILNEKGIIITFVSSPFIKPLSNKFFFDKCNNVKKYLP